MKTNNKYALTLTGTHASNLTRACGATQRKICGSSLARQLEAPWGRSLHCSPDVALHGGGERCRAVAFRLRRGCRADRAETGNRENRGEARGARLDSRKPRKVEGYVANRENRGEGNVDDEKQGVQEDARGTRDETKGASFSTRKLLRERIFPSRKAAKSIS